MLFDLHTHSLYSDGDGAPDMLLALARQRGVARIALTDHNTLAGTAGLPCIAGVEISTLWQAAAVHILGYGRQWDTSALQAGLAPTRAGYQERIARMVERCHQAGYDKVSLADIAARRAGQAEPAFISYDVAKELVAKHDLSLTQAQAITREGGAAYVPYGDRAMSPRQAIYLLHRVGGLAVLAHPGITAKEQGKETMWQLIKELTGALDGLEVYHHFHDEPLRQELTRYCQEHDLLITGGSDYHGPNHYDFLGQIGLGPEPWEKFKHALG